MRIDIQSTHLEITDALRTYVHIRLRGLERITRLFEREGELLLRVEIARSTRHHHKGTGVYMVELTLLIFKKTFRIEEYGANVRTAIDVAQKRMRDALGQYKDRIKVSRIK